MTDEQKTDETRPSGGAASRSRKRRPHSTYILQAPRVVDDVTCWVDVATVEVPSTTRRVTALRKALAAWGATVPEEGVGVRLLPQEHARVMTVKPKPPEAPQLEIL